MRHSVSLRPNIEPNTRLHNMQVVALKSPVLNQK